MSVLDRAVWAALTGRQAHLATRGPDAVRMVAEVGPFAATASADLAALVPLLAIGEDAILLQPDDPLPSAAFVLRSRRPAVQMVADRVAEGDDPPGIVPLGPDDSAEMLALATLTVPGPFRGGTHRLGGFIGIREQGRLIAMARERLKPPGFAEVSAICTHRDARGRGLARALTLAVMRRIAARGETPFLHAYADNAGAIALYGKLGFRLRREVLAIAIERG